jgi:hypothetical protein
MLTLKESSKLLFTLMLGFFSLMTVAGAEVCRIPDNLERPLDEANRALCRQNTTFLLPLRQSISPEEAALGPKLKEQTFRSEDVVYCRYFYRYQNGSSNKFRCYRTNEAQQFLNKEGEVVEGAKSVSASADDEDGVLHDGDGRPLKDASGKDQRPDILKVRFQDGSARHRENYSSAAASRFSWILGIPNEHTFSVAKVVCFGCEKNPWNEGKNPQREFRPNMKHEFLYASIERKFPAKRVFKAFVAEDKSFTNIPWQWQEYSTELAGRPKSHRVEFETLALFSNLFQVMEHRGSQHVMLCESKYYNKIEKSCSQTLAAIHDMGGAFGNRVEIDPTIQNHPRADYEAYKRVKIFTGATSCQLGYNKPGLKPFLPESYKEFNRRLSLLTPEIIASVLRSAHFAYADLRFREVVRSSLSQSSPTFERLNEEIIQRWTALISEKISIQLNQPCL